jgi:elongation of very long chain fatty acids protein 6
MVDVPNRQYLYADKYYLDIERTFDRTLDISLFVKNNHWIPICTVMLYMVFLVVGPFMMKHRPPMRAKRALFLWNGSLSLFSFCGSIRTVPVLYAYVMSTSMTDIICRPTAVWIGTGPTGLWVMLFAASKFPELTDTVFLVIRKKSIPFLHWFHHAVTLLYSWHACAHPTNYVLSFVTMNYCVHSVMYAYYALMIINKKPAWLSPLFITAGQITQMFVGMCIQMSAGYWYLHPRQCDVNGYNVLCGGLMYSIYLYLFIKFACFRYSSGNKNSKKLK